MSVRDKLLQSFEGQSGRLLFGAALARGLKVTRASVSKQLNILKKAGVPIESSGRKGYLFHGPTDFSLMRLKESKPLADWVHLHYGLSTPSTQLLAKSGAMAGLPGGHVWVAEIQTAGRGRLDRRWESAYGGLWFSLLLRPTLPSASIPALTLVAAMSLQQAVKEVAKVEARLKWPNDLVVASPPAPLPRGEGGRRPGEAGWRKLAGVLTEMSGQVDRTEWVVLGVGMNVNNALLAELKPIATSLLELTGQSFSRSRLLQAFLTRFHAAYRRLQKEGFEPFRPDYWRLNRDRDASVRLLTSQGPVEGIARGVDASGALIVESRRQNYHLSEGEIFL